MPAADAVEASIEQMRSLGDKIKKQREASTAALAEVKQQNAASTKKELDEAQAKKKAGKGKPTPDGREHKPAPVPSRRANVVNEMSFGTEDDAAPQRPAPAASAPAPVRPPEPPPAPSAPARRRQDSLRFGYEDDEYADPGRSTPPPPAAPEPAPSRSSGWSSNRSSGPARRDDDDDYSEQSWLR